MDIKNILIATAVVAAVGIAIAILLSIAEKLFHVDVDERESAVRECLAGNNCGACGYAGCDAFAKAVAEGKADINNCSATAPAEKKIIGEILGVSVDAEETKIVVACNGGNAAKDKYEYMGYGNCRSMELLGGGRKVCPWGCLGMGSCTDACPEHAIDVRDGGYAVVDREKCITCGKCITACPKKLVKRIPASAKVYVACSNCLRGGKDVKAMCTNGCLGCGLCAKNCPEQAITMVNNLPVIDYSKCTGCGLCASKCPAKCIKSCD